VAAKAGHQKVFIMPAGIDGWVKAGKKVEKG
jgi:3-mercaptopyruvate sulfurtransferase SseA